MPGQRQTQQTALSSWLFLAPMTPPGFAPIPPACTFLDASSTLASQGCSPELWLASPSLFTLHVTPSVCLPLLFQPSPAPSPELRTQRPLPPGRLSACSMVISNPTWPSPSFPSDPTPGSFSWVLRFDDWHLHLPVSQARKLDVEPGSLSPTTPTQGARMDY